MGLVSRVKKYKAFFKDKAGNNIDYTTFVYAKDYDEALERANNLMNELKDDSLVKAIVVLITNQGSNWAGIYR
jgi:transcription elongation factor GreA-like protein